MPSQIFISHSTKDKAFATGILDYLRAKGYPDERLFLDSDPRSGLLPGLRWKRELLRAIDDCACLIVVGTKHWEDSKWCFAEALIVTNLDRKIVPLLVDVDAVPAIVEDFQSIRGFSLNEAKLSELSDVLKKLQLSPPTGNTEDPGWRVRAPGAQRKLEVQQMAYDALPWWWRTSYVLNIATFVLVVVLCLGAVASVYSEELHRWLYPPETIVVSGEEFISKVRLPESRESIVGKKVVRLKGVPAADYSASKPRINIDDAVAVNINSMSDNEDVPETLPNPVTFSCVVQSISPLVIGGKAVRFTVYVTEFEQLASDEQ